MLKMTVNRAECDVELDWFLEGSVLAGTVRSGANACRTRLVIDSPEAEADILRVVRLAKQGCFAEQLIVAPVPLDSTVVVNGAVVAAPETGAPETGAAPGATTRPSATITPRATTAPEGNSNG